jgi:hypothetical protein
VRRERCYFWYDAAMLRALSMRICVLFTTTLAAFHSGCGVFDVRADTDAAIEAWAQRTGETDPCRLDAMQHCVGAAATAASVGPDWALLLGQLLEAQQGDADPMDLHNNEAGASCATPITDDPDGAVACCEELLNADLPLLRLDGRCQ